MAVFWIEPIKCPESDGGGGGWTGRDRLVGYDDDLKAGQCERFHDVLLNRGKII